MEATAAVRSFHGMHLENGALKKVPFSQFRFTTGKLFSRVGPRRIISSAKVSITPVAGKSDSELSRQVHKKTTWNSFPGEFEKFILEVCDDTDVAEVKVKVGSFEMHVKRNVGAPKTPQSVISPPTAPPIPSEPMNKPALSSPSRPQEESSATSISSTKISKVASVDTSGSSNTNVVVSAPAVGSFRSGKTIKGRKKLPSCCKEGDMIKEGQVIAYIDQFGTELAVRSNVAGEVTKVLFKDGEAVGFGDPLIAVLPSFQGINKF